MPTDGWMGKEVAVYNVYVVYLYIIIYIYITFSHKKEGNHAVYDNIDGPWG